MQRTFYGLLTILILIIVALSSCKPKCKICDEEKIILSDYNIYYPNTSPNNKCDYIVLKKKEAKIFSWASDDLNKDNDGYAKGVIPIDKAIEYIMMYNEKYNDKLERTSFVDLKRSEVLLYLIDVMDMAKRKGYSDQADGLRIYLADRGDKTGKDSISAIVTSVSDKGETTGKDDQLSPIDWGSLCPPPYKNCATDKKAFMLLEATKKSTILPK